MEYVTIHDDSMRLTAVLDNADAVGYKLVHNDLWTGTFSLPNDDPKNVYCQPGALVMIPDGERMTGLYRITGIPDADVTGTGALTTYDVEHVLATLLDDVIFGEMEIKEQTPADAITALLARQTVQRWVLGVCEYTDLITLTPANETLLSALQKISGQLPDDYTWTFNTGALPWVLNITHADTTDGCGIHYARNLVEIKKTMDASQIVTRLYLLGGADSKGDPVKVGKINDDLDYIEADTLPTWGVRCAIYSNSEIDNAEDLLARGRQVLETYKAPYYTYQATALDLHRVTGQSWDDFLPGKLVRVMDDEHGVRFSARIVSIEKRDVFGDPGGITVTIANQPRDQLNNVAAMADKLGSLDQSMGSTIGGVKKAEIEMEGMKTTTETSFRQTAELLELKASKEEVSELSGRVTTAETTLTVQAEGMTVLSTRTTTLEGLQEETSAQLRVNNDSIGMLVTATQTLDGRISGAESSFEQYADSMELRVTEFEGRMTTAEASITLHADQIESRVTVGEYSTFVTQTSEAISLRALASDVETSLIIQNGLIAAKADRIELDGYVTASELSAATAEIGNLKSGVSSFSLLSASNTSIALLGATTASIATLTVGSSATLPNPTTFGSTAMSPRAFSVDGSHMAMFMGTQDINFKIADTQTYKDGVSAAKDGVYVTALEAYDESYAKSSKTVSASLDITLSNGTTTAHLVSVDATKAYNAGVSDGYSDGYDNGADAVYVRSVDVWGESWNSSSKTISATVDVDLAVNGGTSAHSISVDATKAYNAGSNSVTCTGVSFAYEAGGLYVTVSLSNGGSSTKRVSGY